jgi:hypothetical protein
MSVYPGYVASALRAGIKADEKEYLAMELCYAIG